MRLIHAPDGAVDRYDRAVWLTLPFDRLARLTGFAAGPVGGRLGGRVWSGAAAVGGDGQAWAGAAAVRGDGQTWPGAAAVGGDGQAWAGAAAVRGDGQAWPGAAVVGGW